MPLSVLASLRSRISPALLLILVASLLLVAYELYVWAHELPWLQFGIGTALGVLATAIVALGADLRLAQSHHELSEKVEELLRNNKDIMQDWPAAEDAVYRLITEANKDSESEVWLATYWLCPGADYNRWRFNTKIYKAIRDRLEEDMETHVLLLHPDDDEKPDDLLHFITALMERSANDPRVATPPWKDATEAKNAYIEWLRGAWKNATAPANSSVGKWDRWNLPNSRAELSFVKKDLPFLTVYCKYNGSERLIILFGSINSLAQNGPLGAMATSNAALIEIFAGMLRSLRPHREGREETNLSAIELSGETRLERTPAP